MDSLIKVCGRGSVAMARGTHASQKKNGGTSTTGSAGEDISDFTNPRTRQLAINELSEKLNISETEAEFLAKTLNSWTRSGYKKIKEDQKKGKVTAEIKALDLYFDKMPKYKGEIARGLSFKSEKELNNFLDSTKNGIKLDSHSSFSANVDFSKKFALGSGGTSTSKAGGVLMVVKNNKSAISVKSFAPSDHKDEKEVIGRKGANYKVIKRDKVYDPDIKAMYNQFKKSPRNIGYAELGKMSRLMKDEEIIKVDKAIRSRLGLSPRSPSIAIKNIRSSKARVKEITVLELQEV